MNKLSRALLVTLALCGAALGALGCDSASDADGAFSTCDLPFQLKDAALKDFGEACTAHGECAYGACLMPGDAGNLTNSQFGFCTRGCNCNNSTASQLTVEEKATFSCYDPPGFQGSRRHVVVACGGGADCSAVDSGWTACKVPSVGGAARICHAE